MKVVVLSTTEGDDKPLKYPAMFRSASVLVINKIDLLPYVPCDVEAMKRNARQINPDLLIFETSCTSRRRHCRVGRLDLPAGRGGPCVNGCGSWCAARCRGSGSGPSSTAWPRSGPRRLGAPTPRRACSSRSKATRAVLEAFLLRARSRSPAARRHPQPRTDRGSTRSAYVGFAIRDSDDEGRARTLVMPDIATCDDCLAEILDPANRRYRYPFTNCTNCGPRFSIIDACPTIGRTRRCAASSCARPARPSITIRSTAASTRKPNACPVCGPQLALWDA